MQEEHSRRRWEDVNIDILKRIFDCMTSPYTGQVTRVYTVCRSWELAWLYKKHWSSNYLSLNHISKRNYESMEYEARDVMLMRVLQRILEGYDELEQWRLSIRHVSIPKHPPISDEHLLYIAQRTAMIETLRAYGTKNITDKGFAKAFSHWRNLKYIRLKGIRFKYVNQVIEEIGKKCSSLEDLTMDLHCFRMRRDTAVAIVKYLSRLKKLMIMDADIQSEALSYIFYSDPVIGIESKIYFHFCFLVDGGDDKGVESAAAANPRRSVDYYFESRQQAFILYRSSIDGEWIFQTDEFMSKMMRWMGNED